MTDVTPSSEQTKADSPPPACFCARGHWNDPYPENGQCRECNVFLPANPTAITSELAGEYNRRRASGGKSQDEIAHSVLEDEGIKWDDATEGLRQLSLQFAKTKNVKTLELILQQIGVLKAKPKSGESEQVVEYQVALTAGSVASLKRSLADLEGMLNPSASDGEAGSRG